MTATPRHRQTTCAAHNCNTASARHGFPDNMVPAYRGGAAETMQNSMRLNLQHLLVCRHDDLSLGFHRAQSFRVGEALRFFAMDADDFFDVAGKLFDVALQFIFVRVAE